MFLLLLFRTLFIGPIQCKTAKIALDWIISSQIDDTTTTTEFESFLKWFQLTTTATGSKVQPFYFFKFGLVWQYFHFQQYKPNPNKRFQKKSNDKLSVAAGHYWRTPWGFVKVDENWYAHKFNRFRKKKMSGLPFLVCPLPLAPIREQEEEEEEEERKKKV